MYGLYIFHTSVRSYNNSKSNSCKLESEIRKSDLIVLTVSCTKNSRRFQNSHRFVTSTAGLQVEDKIGLNRYATYLLDQCSTVKFVFIELFLFCITGGGEGEEIRIYVSHQLLQFIGGGEGVRVSEIYRGYVEYKKVENHCVRRKERKYFRENCNFT